MLTPSQITEKCVKIKKIIGNENAKKISNQLTEIFNSYNKLHYNFRVLESKMKRL